MASPCTDLDQYAGGAQPSRAREVGVFITHEMCNCLTRSFGFPAEIHLGAALHIIQEACCVGAFGVVRDCQIFAAWRPGYRYVPAVFMMHLLLGRRAFLEQQAMLALTTFRIVLDDEHPSVGRCQLWNSALGMLRSTFL